jgi:hypothetical protein
MGDAGSVRDRVVVVGGCLGGYSLLTCAQPCNQELRRIYLKGSGYATLCPSGAGCVLVTEIENSFGREGRRTSRSGATVLMQWSHPLLSQLRQCRRVPC